MDRLAYLARKTIKQKDHDAHHGKQGLTSWTTPIPFPFLTPAKCKSNFCGVKGFSPVILNPAISTLILNRSEIIQKLYFTSPWAT